MKEWLLRLTLIGFGFIVAIVAVEFGLAKFAPQVVTYPPGFTEPDKDLGWKGTPNVETGTAIHLRRNAHGFRDKERSYDKEKGTFRILVLGDSFTEAIQVPLEEMFPYILEQKLNAESGRRFEVLNLGIGGYGTDQEYLMLAYNGLKYNPDFVILAFYIGNDIWDNSITLADLRYPKPHFVLNDGKLEEVPFNLKKETNYNGVTKGVLSRVFPYTYNLVTSRIGATPWLRSRLRQIGILQPEPVRSDESEKNKEAPTSEKNNTSFQGIPVIWYDVYARQYTQEWLSAWDVTKAIILKLRNELEANKIRFLVVAIPMELEFKPDRWQKTPYKNAEARALKFDARKPERILSDFLGANNIDYLLLRPEFERYITATGQDLYLPDATEIHWNEEGHRFVAELIYKKLINDKLVHEP